MKKILFLLLLFGGSLYGQSDFIKTRIAISDSIRRADSIKQVTFLPVKNNIITIAQTAVGVRFDSLVLVQLRALEAILLFNEGAIDTSRRIKPLVQWVR